LNTSLGSAMPGLNRAPTDDHARAVAAPSQFIGIEQLTPQQQNALLLASLGLSGANTALFSPQRAFNSPMAPQASPLLFAGQNGSPAAVAPHQAAAMSIPSVPSAAVPSNLSQQQHIVNRHSPIRRRRMRVAASIPIKTELALANSVQSNLIPHGCMSSPSGQGIDSDCISLSLQQQPPERTVYLKILKPHPVVKLAFSKVFETPEEKKQLSRLFVEASLIRQQNGEDISSCLEGTRMVQVIGSTAVFRKLKILCTSQQQNSNMCLKFSLFQFTSSGCEPCPNCVLTSQPIEVYSHPVYLSPGGCHYAQQQQHVIMASRGYSGTPGTLVKWLNQNDGYVCFEQKVCILNEYKIDKLNYTKYDSLLDNVGYEEVCSFIDKGYGVIAYTKQCDNGHNVLLTGFLGYQQQYSVHDPTGCCDKGIAHGQLMQFLILH